MAGASAPTTIYDAKVLMVVYSSGCACPCHVRHSHSKPNGSNSDMATEQLSLGRSDAPQAVKLFRTLASRIDTAIVASDIVIGTYSSFKEKRGLSCNSEIDVLRGIKDSQKSRTFLQFAKVAMYS